MRARDLLRPRSNPADVARAIGLGLAGVGLFSYGFGMTGGQLRLFNAVLEIAYPVPSTSEFIAKMNLPTKPGAPKHGGTRPTSRVN